MKVTEVASIPTVADVLKFLIDAPNDELFTLKELSEKFDISESTLKNNYGINQYKVSHGGRNYYGSKQAIAELTSLVNGWK